MPGFLVAVASAPSTPMERDASGPTNDRDGVPLIGDVGSWRAVRSGS